MNSWWCGATQGVRTLAVPPAADDAAAGAAAGAAEAGMAAVWRAPAPLVTAAVLGSVAAVGAGATAHVLLVDAASGAPLRARRAPGPAGARSAARRAACAPASRPPCGQTAVAAAASRAQGRPPASTGCGHLSASPAERAPAPQHRGASGSKAVRARGAGALAPLLELRYAQQLSALALFAPAPGGPLWAAAGLWVANAVELRPLPGTQAGRGPGGSGGGVAGCEAGRGAGDAPVDEAAEAVMVSLGRKQPRALAAGELGGALRLFVGTACGELVVQELACAPGPRGAGLRAADCVCYQAGPRGHSLTPVRSN